MIDFDFHLQIASVRDICETHTLSQQAAKGMPASLSGGYLLQICASRPRLCQEFLFFSPKCPQQHTSHSLNQRKIIANVVAYAVLIGSCSTLLQLSTDRSTRPLALTHFRTTAAAAAAFLIGFALAFSSFNPVTLFVSVVLFRLAPFFLLPAFGLFAAAATAAPLCLLPA